MNGESNRLRSAAGMLGVHVIATACRDAAIINPTDQTPAVLLLPTEVDGAGSQRIHEWLRGLEAQVA